MRIATLLLVILFPLVGRSADLRIYETRYYTLHTDLHPDLARQVSLRMTRMAEEYAQRTRDFSGAIRQRMPFFLYSNEADYQATGAPRNSAGFFNGRELVALAEDLDARTGIASSTKVFTSSPAW